MINFEARYDETLALWQYRGQGRKNWSKPMKLGQLQTVLQHIVADTRLPINSKAFAEEWSLPVGHKPKRADGRKEDLQNLWEIKGGKVQRIAATAEERNEQQLAELAELLGMGK